MKTKIVLSLLLGTMMSALAFYLALRNVPFENLWNYLKTIDYIWILPSIAIVILAFGLRTVRWQLILNTSHRVDFWSAFHPLMIGFTINCILPGRAGELARPVILSQKKSIPFTTGLATVATERTFDVITLIGLFALVLLHVQPDPDFTLQIGRWELSRAVLENSATDMLILCLVLIGGIVLVGIDASRRRIYALIEWVSKRVTFLGPAAHSVFLKTSQRLTKIISNIASGFALINNPKQIILCLVTSLTIWLLNGLSYYLFALGCQGIGLSFIEIFAMMIIICFFVALPSAPGYWGIWEAGGVFALSLFGVGPEEAAGYTLANHAIQLIPVMLIGIISAWITSVDMFKVSYNQVANHEEIGNISRPASEVSNE